MTAGLAPPNPSVSAGSGSGIENHHPLYDAASATWAKMSHTYQGADAVKQANFTYLPPTGGQREDGALNMAGDGWEAYQLYRDRAEYLDLVKESVQTLVGVMHQEPAVIKLPEEMEPLRESASRRGESLELLLRRINESQLIFGRCGLLADMPAFADSTVLPHLVFYEAQHIINWDDERLDETDVDQLQLVVANETAVVRGKGGDMFAWETERRFRALALAPDPSFENPDEAPIVYTTWTEVDGLESARIAPEYRGTQLDDIPFTFIGANDLDPEPDDIPLEPVANGTISLYQMSADYRQTLHMQGQDTLVIIGDEVTADGTVKDETDQTRVGAGAVVRIAAGDGADAKYVGVSGESLGEQRQAYDALFQATREKGARLLEGRKGQAESGDALQTRVAASTASLKQVALTGAAGLEKALKQIARWIGANPDDVAITPNLDFSQNQPEPRLLGDYARAIKEDDAPFSEQSLHEWAQRQNFTKKTFEEEMELVEAERAARMERAREMMPPAAPPGGPAPDDEETPPDEGDE